MCRLTWPNINYRVILLLRPVSHSHSIGAVQRDGVNWQRATISQRNAITSPTYALAPSFESPYYFIIKTVPLFVIYESVKCGKDANECCGREVARY